MIDAVASTAGFAGIGPVVVVLLGLWLALSIRIDRPPWPVVAALALGAPIFLALVDIRRSGLGIETAGNSRYVYVVVALLLPAATLAAAGLLDRSNVRYIILLGFTALLLFVQMSTLNDEANRKAEIEQNEKHVILASAELLTHHEPIVSDQPGPKFPSGPPFAQVAPNLQAGELERLARDHKLPGNVVITKRDLNTARAYLQVALSSSALVRPGPVPPALTRLLGVVGAPKPNDCVQLTPIGDRPRARFRFATVGTLQVVSSRSGAYFASVDTADGVDFGQSNPFEVQGGRKQVLSVSARDVTIELRLPGEGVTTVCGLQPIAPGVLD